MASLAEKVARIMADNSIGVVGTTLYWGEWDAGEDDTAPDFPTDVVVQMRQGGEGLMHSPPVLPTFDVWVRAKNYTVGDAKCGAIFNVFNSKTLLTHGSVRFMSSVCSMPGYMGRDPQDRALFKMSIRAKVVGGSEGGPGHGGGVYPS